MFYSVNSSSAMEELNTFVEYKNINDIINIVEYRASSGDYYIIMFYKTRDED